MLGRLFPKIIDNNYYGHAISGFAYNVMCVILFSVALGHMFANEVNLSHSVLKMLAHIEGMQLHEIVAFIHLWGSAELVNATWFIIVAIRYRRLIPLMYLLIILEFTLRMFILDFRPLEILTHTNLLLQYLIEPILILFFILSLKPAKGN